jgi:hypothetical protein
MATKSQKATKNQKATKSQKATKGASLARLLDIASASLGPAAEHRPALLVGKRGDELWALLQARNGFYAFESALHVFPSGGSGTQTLERWNAPELWRGHYQDLADGCVFFAEDIFGGQFVLRDDAVHSWDPETGETEELGATLDAWARAILADYETLTGQPLAHAWQAAQGALPEGKRLVPKIPFVTGGEFALQNLYAADAMKAMQFRGDVARQLRDVPDGGQIEIKVVE